MNTFKRVSVFDGHEITKEIYEDSVLLGEKLGNEGYTVFCGGGKGVMETISKGVKMGGGLVIGILNGEDASEANNFLSVTVSTEMGISQNAILAYNCDVALAIFGHYGTLIEIAYAFQLGKPVISYETWDIKSIIKAEFPDEVMPKFKREF